MRNTGLEVWNTATLILCAVLLGFLIWRVDLMNETMTKRPELSGQWIDLGPTRTERYIDEPLEHWKARAFEAFRAFEDAEEGS